MNYVNKLIDALLIVFLPTLSVKYLIDNDSKIQLTLYTMSVNM